MKKFSFNDVINSKVGSKYIVNIPGEGEYVVEVKENAVGHKYLQDAVMDQIFLITDAVVNAQFEKIYNPLTFIEVVQIVSESGGAAYVKVKHSYTDDIEEFENFMDFAELINKIEKGFTSSGIATIIENGDWYVEDAYAK